MNDMALLNSHAFQTNHSIFMYGDDFAHLYALDSY